MKSIMTIAFVIIFATRIISAQENIQPNELENPIERDCDKFKFGNLGFKTNESGPHYIVLRDIDNYLGDIAFFRIEKGDNPVWQEELPAPKKYYLIVFTEDPGRNMKSIAHNENYVYKGEISLNMCENRVVPIEY